MSSPAGAPVFCLFSEIPYLCRELFNFLAMKTAIYFLSVCLALCLAACNNQNEPEPNHQPANPKTFSLAGKMYVGDSKTMSGWTDGWYAVYKFSADSIWRYDTPNKDFSPQIDQSYLSKATYTLKYPNIEVNEYPWPHVFTMQDTLTIIDPNGGTCILR